MLIYRRPRAVPVEGCTLALGNFDGVHLGHQALIKALCESSDADNPPLLMSFHPHPKALITGHAPALLSTLPDRAYWLARYGILHWWLMPFTKTLRECSAQDFIKAHLLPQKPKALWVGEDYRFGYKGMGDIETLRLAGKRAGFSVHGLRDYLVHGERVSSSAVRQALQQHDLEKANALLGHPLTLTARVQTGFARGKALGAPTANLKIPDNFALPNGVYVVACDTLSGLPRSFGVANVGINPTFNGTVRKVEAHFFIAPQDLYGQTLRLEFLHFIRAEKRFESQSALAQQIQTDIQTAKDYIFQQEQS